jgi:hypothetical protein
MNAEDGKHREESKDNGIVKVIEAVNVFQLFNNRFFRFFFLLLLSRIDFFAIYTHLKLFNLIFINPLEEASSQEVGERYGGSPAHNRSPNNHSIAGCLVNPGVDGASDHNLPRKSDHDECGSGKSCEELFMG